MQTNLDTKMCKAHKEEKADYYIVNEPWNKFCKACALNRAICGYKIERALSPLEFQNKILLTSLTQDLKSMIEVCEKESNECSVLAEKITNELILIVSPTLKTIEDFINELCALKNELSDLYDNQINKKMYALHENQSKLFMETAAFKEHLQNLETNCCEIILQKNQDEATFGKITGDIRNQIDRCRARLANQKNDSFQDYITSTQTQFTSRFQHFVEKSKQIKTQAMSQSLSPSASTSSTCQKQNKTEEPPVCEKLDDRFLSQRKPKVEVQLDLNMQHTSISTQRLTGLSLKGMKRNPSNPLRVKNSKILES